MSQPKAPVQPASDDPVESALLARLRAGEPGAYESLVREHSPRMLAVARRMLGNEEDAADALQEAFVSAFRAIGTFDGRSRLSTWLHRVVVNACLMKLRKERRREARQIESMLPRFKDDGHAVNASTMWPGSPGGAAHSGDVRRIVREKIDELPEAYRTVLLLRDIEEIDTEEAALMLELSVSAVKTRLHRARQALRELLDPMMTAGSL